LVSQAVSEEQHAAEIARKKSRSKHRVRVFLHKQRHHLRDVARVIFQVRIVHHDQVRINVSDRRADRRALALILRVLQENPFKILQA